MSHHRLCCSLITYTHYFPSWGKMDKLSGNEVAWHERDWWFKKASLSGVHWMDTEQAVLPHWLPGHGYLLGTKENRIQELRWDRLESRWGCGDQVKLMYWLENIIFKCEIDTVVIPWPFYNSIKKLWEMAWKVGITHHPDTLKTIFNLHILF